MVTNGKAQSLSVALKHTKEQLIFLCCHPNPGRMKERKKRVSKGAIHGGAKSSSYDELINECICQETLAETGKLFLKKDPVTAVGRTVG